MLSVWLLLWFGLRLAVIVPTVMTVKRIYVLKGACTPARISIQPLGVDD